MPTAKPKFDALLVVSFGGPEHSADVLPFLENVTRGRNVPRERLLEVAEHYYHFGGASPINAQNRALIEDLRNSLPGQGIRLPIYWGNRNWQPFLPDALRAMADDGIERAIAFVTSAFSSYSGCRQYRENLADAAMRVGPRAPRVEKLRNFFNHPGFIAAQADRVVDALRKVSACPFQSTRMVFTAHSIPNSMAAGCAYEAQLHEACGLVASAVRLQAGWSGTWELAYQSRSGPPSQPWLEPDICDRLKSLASSGEQAVVVVPIGFLSDHLEVLYDLDTEALQVCSQAGLQMIRAGTVGTHARIVQMVGELIGERLDTQSPRLALGELGACPDECPEGCCPAPQRPVVLPQRPTR